MGGLHVGSRDMPEHGEAGAADRRVAVSVTVVRQLFDSGSQAIVIVCLSLNVILTIGLSSAPFWMGSSSYVQGTVFGADPVLSPFIRSVAVFEGGLSKRSSTVSPLSALPVIDTGTDDGTAMDTCGSMNSAALRHARREVRIFKRKA
jgi:hypothetical protein